MKIGIICEGHTDRAVIKNLIKGITGLQYADCIALRPQDNYDDTDLANMNPDGFGSWTNVRLECNSRNKISQFLSIEGQDWIVIQIDTLQAHEYHIHQPIKNQNYSKELRNLLIDKINEWLDNKFIENIAYAIAIEEIEAWLLTIYLNSNSTSSASPKSRLKRTLRGKNISSVETYDNYFHLSEPFSKKKNHVQNNYGNRNESLFLFCQELEQKITNLIAEN